MIVAARSRIPHISLWRLSRRHVASLPYLNLCNRSSTLRLRLRNSAHGYMNVCMYEYTPRVSIYTVSTRLSCACTHGGESTGTEIGTGTGGIFLPFRCIITSGGWLPVLCLLDNRYGSFCMYFHFIRRARLEGKAEAGDVAAANGLCDVGVSLGGTFMRPASETGVSLNSKAMITRVNPAFMISIVMGSPHDGSGPRCTSRRRRLAAPAIGVPYNWWLGSSVSSFSHRVHRVEHRTCI
jgi:hypothetical protein